MNAPFFRRTSPDRALVVSSLMGMLLALAPACGGDVADAEPGLVAGDVDEELTSIDLGLPPVGPREEAAHNKGAALASAGAGGAGPAAATPKVQDPLATGSAGAALGSEQLRTEVETIVANAVQTAANESKGRANASNCIVAVMAIDVESGQVLVRRQHDAPLIPASNLKLLTAAAALGGLGPDGEFSTPFEAVGEISGGVLNGDLVVRGSGDPLYRRDGDGGLDPWLGALAESLKQAGIQRVTGSLVLDEGSWLVPGPAPQWPAKSDHWQMYCALAGAFTVNGGSFRATVTPRPKKGAVDVVVRPKHTGLKRRGSVKLGKRNAVNVGANANGLTVKGTIPASSEVLLAEFSAPDPVDLFGHAFVGGLGDRGIPIEGGFIRTRGVGETGQVVHTIRTPITDLLGPILEDSHNSLADQLFLALGAQVNGEGTRASASQAVKDALGKIGVITDRLTQVDGSGLSKANRTSAVQLVGLVAALVKTGGRTAEVFIDALPIAGRTGSLKGRMRGTPAEARVFAKTGWVQGASALSGIAKTLEGRQVVFSILVGYPRVSGMNTKAWKPMQDDICAALVNWSPR